MAPERDTPGTSAAACAKPITIASRRVILSSGRSWRATRSAASSSRPSTISVVPIRYSERAPSSIWSLKTSPKTAIGIVPSPMYQPIRASRLPRSSGSRRLFAHVVVIRHRSSRKYTSTAASVPSWVTAVNAAPGSSQPRKAGTIRRCPVLETGRNSVRPWTMPRTMAWKASMRAATIAERRGPISGVRLHR